MRAWLSEKNIPFEDRDFVIQPLSQEEMAQVAGRLPNGIRDFDNPHRYNDPDYVREIAGKTLTDDQLVGVYVNHPMLIRTPVVVTEEWATAGEPEEQLARRLGVPV